MASNCGSEAFQKKLNAVITQTSHQKPLSRNTPANVSTASSEVSRTIGMRLPV